MGELPRCRRRRHRQYVASPAAAIRLRHCDHWGRLEQQIKPPLHQLILIKAYVGITLMIWVSHTCTCLKFFAAEPYSSD